MTPPRRRRMVLVGLILVGVSVATVLALTAIGNNMLYFFSPTQVKAGEAPMAHTFRVGGLVVDGSVRRQSDGLTVNFQVTDNLESIPVQYTGILPDLFREGQGIVAMGKLRQDGVFAAEEVLAKHDETYMPPEVHEALETAKTGGRIQRPGGDGP